MGIYRYITPLGVASPSNDLTTLISSESSGLWTHGNVIQIHATFLVNSALVAGIAGNTIPARFRVPHMPTTRLWLILLALGRYGLLVPRFGKLHQLVCWSFLPVLVVRGLPLQLARLVGMGMRVLPLRHRLHLGLQVRWLRLYHLAYYSPPLEIDMLNSSAKPIPLHWTFISGPHNQHKAK